MTERKRELDRQVAEKFYDMGWIQEEGDELHGWNHHPADISYPPFLSHYYGTVPRYSEDAEVVKDLEQKIREYDCWPEYVRALEARGATLEAATPEQRCRAAVEIHPVYVERLNARVEAESRERSRAYYEEEARAEEIILSARARLAALAERRSFRFVNTRREEAEDYLRHLTEFEGYDETELSMLRCTPGLFPHVFSVYLKHLGRARGELFAGSDADPESMPEYRAAADELLKSRGVQSFLDDFSVVFMFHQGYSFLYFQSEHGVPFDAPVFQYVEGEDAPKQIAHGFADFLDAELRLMEENNRLERQSGGYLLTVSGGYTRRLYPAQGDGPAPIEMDDDLV